MGSKSLTRSRWAAIGAAVAVTLGGGGLIGVQAANSSGDSSSLLETVDPTRILDTRGSDKVSGETYVLQVTGDVTTYTGDGTVTAEVVPSSASAVGINLTVTEGVRNQGYGFVTAFPCSAASDEVPSTSTLNFVEGTDVANSTTVPLGPTGKICLNVYGSAHLIVDVSSYFKKFDAMSSDPAMSVSTSLFEVKTESDCTTVEVGAAASTTLSMNGNAAGTCVLKVRPTVIHQLDANRRITGGTVCWTNALASNSLTITPTLRVKPSLAENYKDLTVNWVQGAKVSGILSSCGIFTVSGYDANDLGLGYIFELDISDTGGSIIAMENATFALSDF